MNLRSVEHRHEHSKASSTVVHPNGSLMVSSHQGLILVLAREVLKMGAKK